MTKDVNPLEDILLENILLKNERIDDLLCNGFCLIQNPSYFCFGMDAVLLANFVKAKKSGRCIDFCSGNGIIPILMRAKDKGSKFYGIEIQKEVSDMAKRSAQLNKCSDTVEFINADVKKVRELFSHDSFDTVTVNPPYINGDDGLHSELSALNIARHEILINLEDCVREGAFLLKQGGTFAMVHKPFRLPEIISVMKKYKLEPKRMQLVEPKRGKEANMVLIEGIKGGRPMLKLLPTLTVYNDDGSYTKELLRYYEEMPS